MSRNKVVLGIETAGEELRLVLAEMGEQGLRVLSEHRVGPGQDISRVVKGLPRRPTAVACALPLHQSAVRVLTLPPTTDENMARVVAMEAEGALPFDSEELALSHHVLGMTDQSRLEVLVAAGPLSGVQELLKRLDGVASVGTEVTTSPIALLNAVNQAGNGGSGFNAVLRVEEHASEMIVLDRNRVVAAQVISIGCGSAVPEPAPLGLGGDGGTATLVAGSPPGWVAALSQQVSFALNALSFDRGLTPERLYLCGQGATHADAAWHLSERMSVPLTVLAPSGDAAPESAAFAVAYGCAVQAAGLATVGLNLTPARITVAREVEQRRQTRMSWGALVGAVAVAGGLVFGAALHTQQRKLDEAKVELGKLQGIPAVEGTSTVLKGLQGSLTAVKEVATSRVPAADLVPILSSQLPPDVWLAELTYNAQTGAVIRGYSRTPDAPRLAQIQLLSLQRFDEVTLDYRNEDRVGSRQVWNFQISCRIRPPVRTRGTRR